MITAKVVDYPDLAKIGAFVVNGNSGEYRKALARHAAHTKQKALEQRVESMESKLDLILRLLGEKNGQ